MDTNPVDCLENILMDVPDLVFAFAEDGRYLFVNRAAAEFLGADPLDVIGYHWTDLGYPESVMHPFMEALDSVFVTGVPNIYTAQSSEERGSQLFDISLTPLLHGGSQIAAVLAIGRDVTKYRAADGSEG
jgi:PAS domain S-box-containing protein